MDTVDGGATLSTINGIPGLHAEVQAVNELLNRFPDIDISDTVTSTFRLLGRDAGDAFEACSNCGNIINDSNILTGRAGDR